MSNERRAANASRILVRPSVPEDAERVLEIWRLAVDATHHFLSAADRSEIEKEVADFLPRAALTLAVGLDQQPWGFMFLHQGHMEALFVDPGCHGQGVGTTLVRAALSSHPRLTTDVNEQNLQALRFYRRLGFEATGRSAHDSQQRPYPILHLRFAGAITGDEA